MVDEREKDLERERDRERRGIAKAVSRESRRGMQTEFSNLVWKCVQEMQTMSVSHQRLREAMAKFAESKAILDVFSGQNKGMRIEIFLCFVSFFSFCRRRPA